MRLIHYAGAAALIAALGALPAGAQERQVEKAGEAVERGAEETGEAVEEAGEAVGEGAEEAADETRDAARATERETKEAARAAEREAKQTARRAEREAEDVAEPDEAIRQAQEKLKVEGHYDGQVDGLMGPETQEALRKYQQTEGIKVTGRLDKGTRKSLDISKQAAADDDSDVEEAAEATGNVTETVVRKTGKGAVKVADVTVEGVKEGGEATGEGVEAAGKGTRAAGDPVDKGVDAAGKGVEVGLDKTGDVLEAGIEGVGTGLKKAGGAVADVFDDDKKPDVTTSQEYDTRQTVETTRALQARLGELGYYSGRIDGVMGEPTEAALKRYQTEKGLEATGKLDPATAKSLDIKISR